MIYAIVGALLVGASLGIFGSGGSILTVPTLTYLLGHDSKVAIAESLGIVGAIALVSAIPYARARLTDWRTAMLFALPGLVGTFIGAWAAGFVAGFVQMFVFAVVMLLAAKRMWDKSRSTVLCDERLQPRATWIIGAQGLGVGVLTGFVGVGGGFLIVPALVLLGGLTMRRAVGTSLIVIAMNSTVGFWKYQQVLGAIEKTVDWNTIGVFILIGAIGSLVGSAVGGKMNQTAMQRGFAIFLLVMAGFILARESWSLVNASSAKAASADVQVSIATARFNDGGPSFEVATSVGCCPECPIGV